MHNPQERSIYKYNKVCHIRTIPIILKHYLNEYIHLKNLTDYFESEPKHFYTRKVNSFTWACISRKVEKDHLKYKAQSKASQCPQQYVSIDKYGIDFGFAYGRHMGDATIEVQSIKSHTKFLSKIFEMLNETDDLKLYKNGEIEGKYETIKAQSIEDIKEKWSKSSLLMVVFEKSSIPSNFNEIIYRTFNKLLNLFIYSSFISDVSPEKRIESLENINELNAESSIDIIKKQNFEEWLKNVNLIKTDPPEIKKSKQPKNGSTTKPRTDLPNYDKQKDKEVGDAGEAAVFKFEQKFVKDEVDENLLELVKHKSKKDVYSPYDIESLTKQKKEKFIEVKTTTGGKNTSFAISANEVKFSKENAAKYSIYCVYNFSLKSHDLKFFEIEGDISKKRKLEPTEYRCYPNRII